MDTKSGPGEHLSEMAGRLTQGKHIDGWKNGRKTMKLIGSRSAINGTFGGESPEVADWHNTNQDRLHR